MYCTWAAGGLVELQYLWWSTAVHLPFRGCRRCSVMKRQNIQRTKIDWYFSLRIQYKHNLMLLLAIYLDANKEETLPLSRLCVSVDEKGRSPYSEKRKAVERIRKSVDNFAFYEMNQAYPWLGFYSLTTCKRC